MVSQGESFSNRNIMGDDKWMYVFDTKNGLSLNSSSIPFNLFFGLGQINISYESNKIMLSFPFFYVIKQGIIEIVWA